MKQKLLPLLTGLALLSGAATESVMAQDYCTSGSLTRTTGDRNLVSFTLSDGISSIDVPVNQGTAYGSASYFDKTTTVFSVAPQATISFSSLSWNGSWMHGYVYIDYDKDGEFNTTVNADGTGSGELVSFSYYNNLNDNDAPNSRGETVGRAGGVSASTVPSFTLPADIAPGEYRLRFKIDWNSLNPCGATIEKDGGVIVDMILLVEAPAERTVTVKSSDPKMGSVAIAGTDKLSITAAGPVEISATPFEGYSFSYWTDDATSKVFSNEMTVSVGGNSDMSLTAQFTDFAYPGMTRTFTNNANQQNRYLAKVTTTGTNTPVVFEAQTQSELPYIPFTAGANRYQEEGAVIDKTANPIVVENGTSSFDITYIPWLNNITSYESQMQWTQEAYFVDWNRNGRFNDEGEISGKGNTTVPNPDLNSPEGMTRTITIPDGTPAGTYRLRVVFYEPASNSDSWQTKLFTTYNSQIRNGVAYDFSIAVTEPREMSIDNVAARQNKGEVAPGSKNVAMAVVTINASGTSNPLSVTGLEMAWLGDDVVENLRWEYSRTSTNSGKKVADADVASTSLTLDVPLAYGVNNLILVGDVKEGVDFGSILKADVKKLTIGETDYDVTMSGEEGIEIADVIDYTLGNALWFDTPNSSTAGAAAWTRNDFSGTDTNPDQIWERKSFPIGNGSFGGNVLGSINRERVVLNEKTLWKGGPGANLNSYWNMNRTVDASTLANIRQYLANGQTYQANNLVANNYRGNVNYTRDLFGTYTMMGEAYVSTGIDEEAATDYKRIVNMDRSLVVVEFKAGGSSYTRQYFTSYPDSVMVWRFTSSDAPQTLTFNFVSPQNVLAVTSPADGSLLYDGKLDNNNMKWALRVTARSNDGGTVKADPTARTITVSGSKDVEFLLAGDTDYAMNFDPDFTDAATYVGVDPLANVNAIMDNATSKSYKELYDTHYADYSALYSRVDLSINPDESFENLPTPTRLANYRNGKLDHALEQQYFQYGRYLLISSSRAGNMPANLQGMWHNNTDGPWRVDYHNNINLQMNYWPATATNLLECFTPLIDYVRGLVKPGEKTAQAYYGARGWTAEVSTNIFGFTAPLNATDMSWNYNPTAGPWLATQMWEYYDYTRDKEWLREIGYPIIKSSANFVSDLLYLHNGTFTSAPSYSPEHGSCDLGATYANAVTREVLSEAIQAAEILGENPSELSEWKDKLDKMYPYQIGRYGQLQEWYNDIDTYGDTHRHTNHLFGLHPGTSINSLTDTKLVDACKETLRQRGDDATGWSMGWKLNHWARLLDGDHAYILFQNLLKNGTADNMWDLHPPFQIDGNFGGTAGVSELFLQSHNGVIHLLPALPAKWTNGHINGLRTRGNFTVDIEYADGKLASASIVSNAGEPCKLYYKGVTEEFETEEGHKYLVTFDEPSNSLKVIDEATSADLIEADEAAVSVNSVADRIVVSVAGEMTGDVTIEVFAVNGMKVRSLTTSKEHYSFSTSIASPAAAGIYLVKVSGKGFSATEKIVVK